MKQNRKAVVDLLTKKAAKKDRRFESLIINLALQKIDSDGFDTDGEAVYTADRKRLVYCMADGESFTVPDGVEVVGEMAFLGKRTLKSVVIAASVREIEKKAFYDCDSLESVVLPAGVCEVGNQAFSDCDNLKQITFEGVPKHLSRHALDDCDKLHYVIVPEGCGKVFRKALHYIEDDTEYSVVEDARLKVAKTAKKDKADKPTEKKAKDGKHADKDKPKAKDKPKGKSPEDDKKEDKKPLSEANSK